MLLDSQAALWLLDDSPRLGQQAREQIQSAARVHVSAATVWELTIKTMLGTLSVPADLSTHLVEQGLDLISITAEHAEAIRKFPELVRHDPFDRLLVAQASTERLRLMTADDVLLAQDYDFLVDARK